MHARIWTYLTDSNIEHTRTLSTLCYVLHLDTKFSVMYQYMIHNITVNDTLCAISATPGNRVKDVGKKLHLTNKHNHTGNQEAYYSTKSAYDRQVV